MNAIQFLLKEHDHVRNVFSKIKSELKESENPPKKLYKLCDELVVHENMEQTVWYPYLKKYKEIAKIITHLMKEEKKAEKLIKKMDVDNVKGWKKQFRELKKEVEHHASEEEKNLFPLVKKIIQKQELEDLGNEMRAFKKEKLGRS